MQRNQYGVSEMMVLIVLGHRLNDDGTMTEVLKHRLDTALKVAKAKLTADNGRVLLTGGAPNKAAGKTEAEVMKAYMLEQGFPEEMLLTESLSNTTKENAKFCAPIVAELKADSVMLCSSQYHLERWYLNPLRLFRRYLGKTVELIPLMAVEVEQA